MYPLPDEKTLAAADKGLGIFKKYFPYVIILLLGIGNVYQYFETRTQRNEKDTLQQDRIKDLKDGLRYFRDGYMKSQQEVIDDYRRHNTYNTPLYPGNKP